ncbi:MAG: 2OG-Fe(II) oxygenase [Hyphomonadaceae bacterium]|nr:2OG-Fe(II) oxygenase [Hyphomonadaceae bacterium]
MPGAPADERTHVRAIFCAGSDPRLVALSEQRLIFTDPDLIARYGLVDPALPEGRWILVDPTLRIVSTWPLTQSAEALAAFDKLPPPDLHAGVEMTAPVLVAPRIFEPQFCEMLIRYYQARGGEASGVTRQHQDGRTYVTQLEDFKRRSDCLIEDTDLRDAAMKRIYWRLSPMIERAFMWRPTRMERYLVAAYEAEGGGFFKPHRDNTTNGTAHRRFAVTINLNTGDYDGGDLRFPEFGSRTYRAPTGGAVVFSCAMLHEATPVTRGTRYAFLPFLYDEAAAEVRRANNKYLDESLRAYDS